MHLNHMYFFNRLVFLQTLGLPPQQIFTHKQIGSALRLEEIDVYFLPDRDM
jgi:hypothetical protein